MERAKQLGKIDARCILETAGHLIDHASRVTYELRGVAIAIHLNGVDSCQRLCDSLGDLRHDIDVAIGEKIGVLSSALRKTKMLLCLRSGPLITSTYAINVLKRPSEPLRRNSRQLAKTSYFTYPYIVACGLKNFRDFKSKRNVDLFVVLSALRLGLRCLRNE